MIALLDADIYRYQFGSVEMKHPFLVGEMVPADAEYIKHLVDMSIQEVLDATGADSYICALSGKGNFRNELATYQPYKGNRDPKASRPYHYTTIEQHIIANHPHVVVHGMEADDWLGIEQRKNPGNTCIASRDKDLKTVYGYHYRFACGKAQPAIAMHWMTEEESSQFFFYQMLIGDNTDNIPGCGKKEWAKWGKTKIPCYNGEVLEVPHWVKRRKGVGSATAIKILDKCQNDQERYEAIKAEYEKVYGEEHEGAMLEMARLLFIGQTPDNLFDWNWLNICKHPTPTPDINSVSKENSKTMEST